MNEGKKPAIEDVLKQINDFENTLSKLSQNVLNLKAKLQNNKEKYGPDISKWPKEAHLHQGSGGQAK